VSTGRAVAADLGIKPAEVSVIVAHEPLGTVYSFDSLGELHDLDRTYRLGVSLPDAPLKEFLED